MGFAVTTPGGQPARHPAVLGVLGLGLLILVLLSVMSLDRLPIVGAAISYRAEFSEAAGLKSGNEVRVAGVKVGSVTGVGLSGDRVMVAFRVKGIRIGNETTASIQIKTLLGQKYLALDPQGAAVADPNTPIPLSRTVSPYDVVQAFSDASRQIQGIDTTRLAQSMRVLSRAFAGTPGDVRSAIDGVSRISDTLAKRDRQLRALFAATAVTSRVLADRNVAFERLLANGGLLITELNLRQRSISQLLTGTKTVSFELSTLVHQNERQIGPALLELNKAVEILNSNQRQITRTLQLAAPFYGIYASVLGNGRWFDAVVTNLIPPQLPDPGSHRPPVRTVGGR